MKPKYTDAEKEEIHRTYRRKVYHIYNTENLLFDQETEEQVTEDLAQQADQINLSIENPLIAPITLEEITKVIKYTKNKAPGISQIRKPKITNIPPIMIQRLINTFNVSLASGYFPGV